MLAYIDGSCVDRIIGFEGLGKGTDSFTTRELESRLLSSSVLLRAKTSDEQSVRPSDSTSNRPTNDDDDDWD